jgi:hypothetical protein
MFAISVQLTDETLADVDIITEQAREAQKLVGAALRDYQQIAQYKW